MGKGSGLPCQPGGNASPGGGPPHRAAPQARGGAGARVRSCRAGRPFAGPPRAQPHKALALDSVIWFPILQQDTLVPDASVARRGTVVVLSLCEAAKREFGGFVQRVFRGFTSTIKLGVFEHPTELPYCILCILTHSQNSNTVHLHARLDSHR